MSGFLIPAGDPDALADRVLRLLNAQELAQKMGRAGRKLIEEKFTLQKMIAQYETLFTDLVK